MTAASVLSSENDPAAAAWQRELMRQGAVGPAIVDERDIRDIRPDELPGYAQCHFFSGIAGWQHALDLAGLPRGLPLWTGSCPCQPFSAAGKRGGTADERHLWPSWFHLIDQCRPPVVFGEQVASKDGLGWLDTVCADLEGAGYAVGVSDLCAAGVGAPHIRQRLYFGAIDMSRAAEWLAHADDAGLEGRRQPERERAAERPAGPRGVAGGVANPHGRDASAERQQPGGQHGQQPQDGGTGAGSGPADGFWRDADWLGCRDGKWRPVEPGSFPLAHGLPARVGRLRGYGNAIVPQVAATFVLSFIEAVRDTLDAAA